ncbi:SET domain-containing protein [Mycena crocata]|nr:SET domain-containing protein [Mycena crocata]
MVFVDSLESVQTISKWPLWDEPCSPVHTPSFEIRDSGKGLGMFAQRQIERGELIMRERPVYVTHPTVQINPDQKHRFYEAALAGLSRTTQTSILSLHNAHPESDDVSPIRGRILTNALPATLPNTTTRFPALFSHLCRANHACTPNAQFSFCADIFVGRLCALRTIGAGEEVTIGYTELAAPREARQADLKARYGFACTCATCMLPESQAALSDVKRGGITRYFADMKGERFPPGASLGCVKQLITWAEEEGLIEAASALGISALRLVQRDQNHWEVLKFTVDTMNYWQSH